MKHVSNNFVKYLFFLYSEISFKVNNRALLSIFYCDSINVLIDFLIVYFFVKRIKKICQYIR